MPIREEADKNPPTLATSREPVAPRSKDGKGKTIGDQALMDAVILIGAAWLVLILLTLSLRSHNI